MEHLNTWLIWMFSSLPRNRCDIPSMCSVNLVFTSCLTQSLSVWFTLLAECGLRCLQFRLWVRTSSTGLWHNRRSFLKNSTATRFIPVFIGKPSHLYFLDISVAYPRHSLKRSLNVTVGLLARASNSEKACSASACKGGLQSCLFLS